MGKLDIHDRMLQQCGSYSFSSAKCSVESDRPLIETLVSELWEGSMDPISDFNRFVNRDLAAHIAARVGRPWHMPYKVCLLVSLPLTFSGTTLVITLPTWHSFRTKLDIHDRMLQQCGSYGFSSA